MLKSVLAPAEGTVPGEADRGRDIKSGVVASEVKASAAPSESDPDRVGRFTLGGVWNGRSVGDMYLSGAFEGPATSPGSSSMGVIGGGGVMGMGGDREVSGAPLSGEEASGAEEEPGGLGLRDRCARREDTGEAPTGGEPTVPAGRTPPPTSSRMLPRSLP